MKFKFAKMQALGNDFVVIDGVNQSIHFSADDVRALADRHRGIGFDQLLLVEPATHQDVDFRYRVFNADGSEVAQCGNGARCVARFIREQGLSNKEQLTVETLEGQMQLRLLSTDIACVSLGVPRFKPEEIPHQLLGPGPHYQLEVATKSFTVMPVNVGNPHIVIQVDDVSKLDVKTIGAALGAHPAFTEGVNVGFVQVESPKRLKLRVYERGAGETEACGSGACAAAVIARCEGWCQAEVEVAQPGGTVQVRWGGEGQPVWLTGSAQHVFNGEI